MNKKDGTKCVAKLPTSPMDPDEADNADPGDMIQREARKRDVKAVTPTSQTVDAYVPPEKEEEKEEELHWIEISLVDDDGNPVPDEEYRVKLPDGKIVGGRLDGEGKARVDGIPDGQCEVCFPAVHGDEWSPV